MIVQASGESVTKIGTCSEYDWNAEWGHARTRRDEGYAFI